VVERDLAKVDVAGSTPVSRSRFFIPPPARSHKWTFFRRDANVCSRARYPSGKGEVCKTFTRRFDSDPRLQTFLAVACLACGSPRTDVSSWLGLNRAKLAKFGLRGGQKADRVLTLQFGLPSARSTLFRPLSKSRRTEASRCAYAQQLDGRSAVLGESSCGPGSLPGWQDRSLPARFVSRTCDGSRKARTQMQSPLSTLLHRFGHEPRLLF
jgi:hypothetical protein